MSTHNLLMLVRNMRQERDMPLVYDNKKSSWSKALKNHPLESAKNANLFQNIAHCRESFGTPDSSKKNELPVILRSGYTWSLLKDISKNSLKDCATFYEVAKHTILSSEGVLHNSVHLWFKTYLTSIYLSKPDAPEELNFLKELNQKQKEHALSVAFQNFGTDAVPQYKKLKKDFNIEHFHEKLVLWYWDVNKNEINLLAHAIDKIKGKAPLNIDLEYFAENIKPNNLLKYQSVEINKQYVPFSEVTVLTERYEHKSVEAVCCLEKEKPQAQLDEIFNLFWNQSSLKELYFTIISKQSASNNHVVPNNKVKVFTSNFESVGEIFDAYPISKDSRNSMNLFIETFNDGKSAYWKEVESTFAARVLEEDLKSKNIKKHKNKV